MKKKWLQHYQEGVPEKISYPDVPLSENLVRSAKDFPDCIATSLFGNDLTYKELNENANAVNLESLACGFFLLIRISIAAMTASVAMDITM